MIHLKIARGVVLALLAASTAACGDDDVTVTSNESVVGSTPGFYNGSTITFDYTKNFECNTPPASGATSKCEVGAGPQSRPGTAPAGSTPILYVLTPLFSPAPPASTLHCPTQGNCVTHPTTVDLSAALGPGAANAPLPPHSHVIDQLSPNTSRPYELKVVGVSDATVWSRLVAGASLATVRSEQSAGTAAGRITSDLPTNIFLFFRTRQ